MPKNAGNSKTKSPDNDLPPEIDWHSPDYLPVIKNRISALNRIRSNSKILEAVKIHYANNPADFITDWMVTYDPRRNPAYMPFLLWPKQREYISWVLERYRSKEDGLVEKSRDAGATYLNCGFSVWLNLFEVGSKVSFGSRKQDLVDKIGDTDTIFEKIRIILRNMPVEFLPKGYNELKHATFMKVINPENGATITGEAGDNIGRGGRSGIYFKDESAFYERPELIDAALSQNSDVKIDVSTPCGMGTPFYNKRHGGKIPVFIFDWRDDPRKDDAWYQRQKDTLEPWIVAQEIDRDYGASIEGVCIPAQYVKAAVGYKTKTYGLPAAGLDVADEAGMNVFVVREGSQVVKIEKWTGANTTRTSRMAMMYSEESQVVLLNYDSIGVGAGVTGELSELKIVRLGAGQYVPNIQGVNTGNDELLGMYTDTIPEKKMFLNMRANLWWRMRRRFERTYETVNGIKTWPPDELIGIPDDKELISQLSQPLVQFGEGGKIKIESKKDMKKRGIKSPDHADALMLSFANPEILATMSDPIIDKNPVPGLPQRIHDYVTGKAKRLPEQQAKQNTKKYVDIE